MNRDHANTADIASKFERALALHQQGNVEQAKILYEEILTLRPHEPDVLHLLGLIAGQENEHPKAVDLIERAIALTPDNAIFHSNLGNIFQDMGKWNEAVACYDKALALKADYAEAYSNRGNVLVKLNQFSPAIASYDNAVKYNPHYAKAYFNRGNAQNALHQHEAALASYTKAVELQPDHAQAHFNCGVLLQKNNQFDAALASYDKAIALKPDYAEAYYNRGILLQENKQPEAALASYDKAIALKPDYAEAYCNRGNVLKNLKKLPAATQSYDEAIELKPDYVEAYSNRGVVQQEQGQIDAALASYDKAIALKPDYAEAYCNRGIVEQELNQLDAALASYDKALALNPDYAPAYFNKAFLLLLRADFEKGWELYEWRWKSEDASPRSFTQKLWLGKEPLAGKTILLHWEQGLGDTLQFCRYVKQVADLGARVILEVQPPLRSLLQELPGVSQLIAYGDALPAFDYYCPLVSLPMVLKTRIDTIPSPAHYLYADKNKVKEWQRKLGEKTKPRIGLVWSGNSSKPSDKRKIPLAQLLLLLPDTFQYVRLQKDVQAADKPTLAARADIIDMSDHIHDFSDTAALCELMDLVITIDTSVAHLSGALGKKTWVLLAFSPDWRWLLERADSPWYASATLYRQETLGDWSGVLERVKADLLRL